MICNELNNHSRKNIYKDPENSKMTTQNVPLWQQIQIQDNNAGQMSSAAKQC